MFFQGVVRRRSEPRPTGPGPPPAQKSTRNKAANTREGPRARLAVAGGVGDAAQKTDAALAALVTP